jgi:MFS superfamily sulfate permease-like transporter
VDDAGNPTYVAAAPGAQSLPGLVVFRYDAELFYANANRFTDDVEAVVAAAPDPVRWLVLDCSATPDVDYSAAISLSGLIKYVQAKRIHFAIVGADTGLQATLKNFGVLDLFDNARIYADLDDVIDAFRGEPADPAPAGG